MNELPKNIPEKNKLNSLTLSELHSYKKSVNKAYAQLMYSANILKCRSKSITSMIDKRTDDFSIKKHPNKKEKTIDDNTLGITEHATYRYLERVKGIDMRKIHEDMREEISKGESYLDGQIIDSGDVAFYLNKTNDLVITIIPHEI